MKKIIGLLILILSINNLYSQSGFLSYYELKDFMQTSPGAFKYGLYGYFNPATTTYLNEPDLLFTLSEGNKDMGTLKSWGIFMASPKSDILSMNLPSSGYGIISENDGNKSVYNFRYSFGLGNRIFNFGFGFGYSFGDVDYFNRSGILFLGGLIRPFRELSIGLQRTFAFEKSGGESVVELAIRPVGTYPFAVFADVAMFDKQSIKKANWSAGLSWEFLDGLRLNGRYFKDKSMALGIDMSLGNIGFSSQSQFDKEQKYGYNSYSIRLGASDRTFADNIGFGNTFVQMDLKGAINYNKFLWFDNSNKLLDILQKIDEAKKSSSINGLVINVSGMNANMEIAWEVREKLKEFKTYGKKVIIFTDRIGLTGYHFASIADKIVMDPQGAITLEGFALGRSYYKKMLDDAGIGFEELRYFKYKSAYENFGRDNMSDGDREQRQKLIDDWYEFSRKEICESRNLSPEKFDELVDGSMIYIASEAYKLGLVDTLARWNDVKEIMDNLEPKSNLISSSVLWKSTAPTDDRWGEPTKAIAVVYALGACAMDNGINARELSKYLKKVAESGEIGAIILRVDSPGGDGMASDVVSEVLRKFKGKKPIIVSQGAVAASGGYWLSMDADTILAAPMTITGSIGVIGAWFYDKGLADSLGIKTEIVKRGKYADLGYPFLLPLISIGLPARNLNEDEKGQMEKMIIAHYKDFVTKVSTGRGMEYDKVHDIAQGRVWTGLEGNKIGLVDKLGGLDEALKIAKKLAGYDLDDEVMIVEYPKPELFDLSSILPGLLGVNINKTTEQFKMLKFRIDNNGIPMPIMPIEYFEFVQDK
ncbi:MAG: signal peptide peptidase SppA [bacterium]